MPTPPERILVVESDPDISDLIIRQALQPLGYQTSLASDAASAIRQAVQLAPDLILADLNLPGLSGKDLIVALTSQGISTPLVVLANQGEESKVVQAFRLGAADYLLLPARDAEIVSAVERALNQTRESRARAQLDLRLKQTNQELQRRLRDLTTIFTIGRAVVSISEQRLLFDKIVEGGLQVSEADMGWLLLRDETHSRGVVTAPYLLAAQRNLPEAWARKLNQPLDDGLGALVAASAESLSIHGEPLKQFKISALAGSALVSPIKVQQEVIGLITMVRKSPRPFNNSEQSLLEALADYASISLVNARLFRALAQSAEAAAAHSPEGAAAAHPREGAARVAENRKADSLEGLRAEIQAQAQAAVYPLEHLLSERGGALSAEQKRALETARASVEHILALATPLRPHLAEHPRGTNAPHLEKEGGTGSPQQIEANDAKA